MRKQLLRSLAVNLLAALVLTAMAGLGLLAGPDGVVSDALYHRSGAYTRVPLQSVHRSPDVSGSSGGTSERRTGYSPCCHWH